MPLACRKAQLCQVMCWLDDPACRKHMQAPLHSSLNDLRAPSGARTQEAVQLATQWS